MSKENKLIAEFMGIEIITDDISYFDKSYKPLKKYHESWDCLMPVVEKIYVTQGVKIEWSLGHIKINCSLHGGFKGSGFCLPTKKSIDCWYLSVVEFIEWFNKHTRT